MERKVFSAVELKAGQTGAFRAIVATLNTVDRDGDVTLPGAFRTGQEAIISAFDHASVQQGKLPVGKGVIGADQTKAWVEGRFFLDTAGGLDAYKTVKALGSMAQWSHGYIVVASRAPTPEDRKRWPKARRILVKLDVVEVSPVVVAAGVGTGTAYVKGSHEPTSDLSPSAMAELVDIKARLDQAELAQIREEAENRTLPTKCEETLPSVEDLAVAYAEVAPSHVDPVLADLAAQVIETASANLGISPPRIRWFYQEGPQEWLYIKRWGVADWVRFKNARADLIGATWPLRKDQIWVRADLAPDVLVTTVAHESAHLAQGTKGTKFDEGEADAFGRSMCAEFFGYRLPQ